MVVAFNIPLNLAMLFSINKNCIKKSQTYCEVGTESYGSLLRDRRVAFSESLPLVALFR
jgi:hypothetical protein